MYKPLIAIMCLSLVFLWRAQAQQVISNGGGSFQNGGATMTFTIGETVIATFSQSNGIMSQGFNQAQMAPELQVQAEVGTLISGAELLFELVEPGESSTLILTLRNLGNGPLSINGLNFMGDPVFSIEGNPSLPIVLAAAAEQVLIVSFNPVDANDYTGLLRIESTDPNVNPFTINLRGNALIVDLPVMSWPATLLISLVLLGLSILSIRVL